MSRIPLRLLACSAALCGLALLNPAGAEGAVQAQFSLPVSALPAPSITSTGHNVYVSGSAKNLVGTPGQFTFSDSAGSGVVRYLYGLGNSTPVIPLPATTTGTATLNLAPYNASEFDLYVAAQSKSGQVSQPSEFRIETILPRGNVAALAWWKLTAGHGASAQDATGHGHIAKLAGSAALRCGPAAPDGDRCWLNLVRPGSQAVTPKTVLPIVGSNGSFAVSAWVRAAACATTCVAVSQDATQTSGFSLAYRRSCTASGQTGPCWLFTMPEADSKSAPVHQAQSLPGTAHIGKWIQLTGGYDAAHQALTLYVNGIQAGQLVGAAPWTAPAAGPLRLGGVLPGAADSSWTGRISNVCVFYGALQTADVRLLYSGDSSFPHNGCAALQKKYP